MIMYNAEVSYLKNRMPMLFSILSLFTFLLSLESGTYTYNRGILSALYGAPKSAMFSSP